MKSSSRPSVASSRARTEGSCNSTPARWRSAASVSSPAPRPRARAISASSSPKMWPRSATIPGSAAVEAAKSTAAECTRRRASSCASCSGACRRIVSRSSNSMPGYALTAWSTLRGRPRSITTRRREPRNASGPMSQPSVQVTMTSTSREGSNSGSALSPYFVAKAAARPVCEKTLMSTAPRARSAATVVAAYRPVPTTRTELSAQSTTRLEASSRARRTSERAAPPTAVLFRTSRLVCVAFWNSCSRSRLVVPARRALLSARCTCPEISSSPTTTDSSPDVTANRCFATASFS